MKILKKEDQGLILVEHLYRYYTIQVISLTKICYKLSAARSNNHLQE